MKVHALCSLLMLGGLGFAAGCGDSDEGTLVSIPGGGRDAVSVSTSELRDTVGPSDIMGPSEETTTTGVPDATTLTDGGVIEPDGVADHDAGCIPDCAGAMCGPDQCGGSCGQCPDTAVCSVDQCLAICVPDCAQKACGDNGCGGTCGVCVGTTTCEMGVCLGDGSCKAALDCMLGCNGPLLSCLSACTQASNPQAGAAAGAFGNCLVNACGAQPSPACFGQAAGTQCAGEFVECVGCAPSCNGKTCGPDGCGGSCGQCAATEACEGSACVEVCTPTCAGQICGTDGCGGLCGLCPADTICDGAACQPLCTPNCKGKSCGGDGCGGTCGICPASNVCTQTSCQSGACVSETNPDCCLLDSDCNDGDSCTKDVCSNDGDCVHAPLPPNPKVPEICGDGIDNDCNPDTTCFTLVQNGQVTPITPVESGMGVVTFYSYKFVHDFSADTGYESEDKATVLLHKDPTGDVALMFILDEVAQQESQPDGGEMELEFSGAKGLQILVYDDIPQNGGNDEWDFDPQTGDGHFHWFWSPCCTDGVALGYLSGTFCLAMKPTAWAGINGIRVWTNPSQYTDLNPNVPFQICGSP